MLGRFTSDGGPNQITPNLNQYIFVWLWLFERIFRLWARAAPEVYCTVYNGAPCHTYGIDPNALMIRSVLEGLHVQTQLFQRPEHSSTACGVTLNTGSLALLCMGLRPQT